MDFGIIPELAVTPTSGTGFDSILTQVREAEALGYTGCFVPDHYVFEEIGTLKPERPAYDPFLVLGAVAQATERMKLITHVACTIFRHPAMNARLFAQLDELSGGRVIAGVGAGWTRAEFEMMGIDFPEISERLKMMDEHVDIMRGLWTNETFSYEGEFHRLTNAVSLPKPTQASGPPIMLGGSGKGILRRAGQWADILHMAPQIGKQGTTTPAEIRKLTDDEVARKLEFVAREAQEAGRPTDAVTFATTIFNLIITESPAKTTEAAEFVAAMIEAEPEVVLRHPSILIGTIDEMVAELIRRRDRHGLGLVGLHPGSAEAMARFAQEVMPHV